MPVLKHRETGAVREFGEREARTYRKRGWEDVDAADVPVEAAPPPRRRAAIEDVAGDTVNEPTPEG